MATKKKQTPQKSEKVSAKKRKRLPIKRPSLSRLKKPEGYKEPKKLSGSFRLLSDSLSFLRQEWKVFGGILLVYFLLAFTLGGGAQISDRLKEVEQGLSQTVANDSGQARGLELLSGLLGSGGGISEDSAIFTLIIMVVVSLATIWALRQRMAGETIRVRDAFYKGMYPFVPVILVLLVIVLQLIPFMIGGMIYGLAFSSGLAFSIGEKLLWILVLAALTSLTLYLISSSIFGLFIVTLPDMTPMSALRSARKLVRYRRWKIMRRLLFLPLALFLIGIVLMLPWLWLLPVVAPWVYLVLLSAALIAALTYVYYLYRELL